MPKGPRGEKRPADAIKRAVMVGKIAIGEIEEKKTHADAKDPNAVALGSKGGASRARRLSPEKRAEIAKKAAEKRWKTKR
jgi:hypothetical protein